MSKNTMPGLFSVYDGTDGYNNIHSSASLSTAVDKFFQVILEAASYDYANAILLALDFCRFYTGKHRIVGQFPDYFVVYINLPKRQNLIYVDYFIYRIFLLAVEFDVLSIYCDTDTTGSYLKHIITPIHQIDYKTNNKQILMLGNVYNR